MLRRDGFSVMVVVITLLVFALDRAWSSDANAQNVSFNLSTKNGETIIQINNGLGLKLENQTIKSNTGQELQNVDVTVMQKLASGQFVYTTTDKDAIGFEQKKPVSPESGTTKQMEGKTMASISDVDDAKGNKLRRYEAQTDGTFSLTFTCDEFLQTPITVVEELDGSYFQVKDAEIAGQYIKNGGISFAWNDVKKQVVHKLDNNTLLSKDGVDVLYKQEK